MRLFLGILRRARRIGRNDLAVLGRLFLLLGKLVLFQRRRALPELIAMVDMPIGGQSLPPISPHRLVSFTDLLLRLTYKDNFCMKRSLLLFHFLRDWGYDVRLRFGVKKEDARLTGHAWIELRGLPLREKGDPRDLYRTTFSFPQDPESPARNVDLPTREPVSVTIQTES